MTDDTDPETQAESDGESETATTGRETADADVDPTEPRESARSHPNATDLSEKEPVTAAPPDSVMNVTGVDHITLIGSNEEDTIEFYRDVLGMPLVLRQPNLDAPHMTHLFFDPGDGRLISFFVQDGQQSHQGPQRPGVGAVHHLAFSIDAGEFREIRENLDAAGHHYNEFDRGAFHSLYTTDHNGLVIELAADAYVIPDDRRGEVMATAQRLRVEAGEEYVKDEHLKGALEELDVPVEPTDLPDAPTGAGGIE